jgi:hypothetical protein
MQWWSQSDAELHRVSADPWCNPVTPSQEATLPLPRRCRTTCFRARAGPSRAHFPHPHETAWVRPSTTLCGPYNDYEAA